MSPEPSSLDRPSGSADLRAEGRGKAQQLPESIGRLGTARIGILTIIDEEFDEVRRIFGATVPVPDSPYYAFGSGSTDVVLRQMADRSNVPAALCAGRLIEDFRPELVIVTGIAGGIDGREGVRPGDVVVPHYLHYAEFCRLDPPSKCERAVRALARMVGLPSSRPRRELHRYFAYDQPSVSLRESYVDGVRVDGEWTSAISADRPEAGAPVVIVGSLVAGEKILGDPTHDWQRQVVEEFSDAVAIDMESIGVARAIHECRRDVGYNPRFLVVRGVSDLVRVREDAEDNRRERGRWKRYAACAAAAFAHRVGSRFLSSRDARSNPMRSEGG